MVAKWGTAPPWLIFTADVGMGYCVIGLPGGNISQGGAVSHFATMTSKPHSADRYHSPYADVTIPPGEEVSVDEASNPNHQYPLTPSTPAPRSQPLAPNPVLLFAIETSSHLN